jgi:hypothetical protein
MADDRRWYWCLVHQRPEPEGSQDRAEDVLGPYPSEEAARNWKQTVEARNEAWDEEDERWEGDESS